MYNFIIKFSLVYSEGEQIKIKRTKFLEYSEITPAHRQAAMLSRLQNVAKDWDVELSYSSLVEPQIINVYDSKILLFENTYKSVSEVLGIGVKIYEEVFD